MTWLVAEGLWYLLRTEWLMRARGFSALHGVLKRSHTRHVYRPRIEAQQICRAVDCACVLYFKRVLCLQRSAATVMLLRHCALPAELVIGAQILPFQSHAWVELDGQVINDKAYVPELYSELERC
jgi:prolyl oligopeptidase